MSLKEGTVSLIVMSNTAEGGQAMLNSRCAKFEKKNQFAIRMTVDIEFLETGRYKLTQYYEA